MAQMKKTAASAQKETQTIGTRKNVNAISQKAPQTPANSIKRNV